MLQLNIGLYWYIGYIVSSLSEWKSISDVAISGYELHRRTGCWARGRTLLKEMLVVSFTESKISVKPHLALNCLLGCLICGDI